MNGYAFSRFTAPAIQVWKNATEVVGFFEELRFGLARCHEVARAVLTVLKEATPIATDFPSARIVDGWYGGADHSWIELSPGTILDPYAVARVPMVQLVDVANALLQSRYYREENIRADVLTTVVNVLVVKGLTLFRQRHAPGVRVIEDHAWRAAELEAAIRKHRDQRGDDRCFEDDYELYDHLPEGFDVEAVRLCDPETMLANCKRFIAARHDPNLTYLSPQREIERLELELAAVKAAIKEFGLEYQMDIETKKQIESLRKARG